MVSANFFKDVYFCYHLVNDGVVSMCYKTYKNERLFGTYKHLAYFCVKLSIKSGKNH